MTGDEIRAAVHEALVPVRDGISVLAGQFDSIEACLTAEPSLQLLARQAERTQTKVASLRDDMRVLTSIVLRRDCTLTALLQETRDTHQQIARMNDRIRKLEDAQS
jgi:hypothetical protein